MTEPSLEFLVAYWGDPVLFRATLDSMVAQDDPGWTAVVVDDAYPDPTIRELLEGGFDDRITYVRNETQRGVAGNFERCRTLASADLACFLGADDLLEPGFVRRSKELATRFPRADILQGGVTVVDADGTPSLPLGDRVKGWLRPTGDGPRVMGGENLAVGLVTGDWLYWPSLVFRRAPLQTVSFNPDLATILDLDLVLRLVLAGSRLVVDDVPTFRYRRHAASASSETLRSGERFAEDRAFFATMRRAFLARGWHRAALAASLRATTRLHAATLLPAALAQRDVAATRSLLTHVLAR